MSLLTAMVAVSPARAFCTTAPTSTSALFDDSLLRCGDLCNDGDVVDGTLPPPLLELPTGLGADGGGGLGDRECCLRDFL